MFSGIRSDYKYFGMRGAIVRTILAVYMKSARKLLPENGDVRYAGVLVNRRSRPGDAFLSRLHSSIELGSMPDYESGLIKSIKKHIKPGDKVTVVGGGLGVTAVAAALASQPNGYVHCYEGSSDGVASVRMTVSLNNVANLVSVHHAVVGENIEVYGPADDAAQLDVIELPECDVLELDCEGSELGILTKMLARPRCVIVETHGVYGSSSNAIRAILRDKGYKVSEAGPAETRTERDCIKKDVMIVVGQIESA